ncbi:cache domain-containing protein [Desulfonema magnum]|uniref:Double cache domain-containing protein n=1 Tax=Desulfonema magnum TaxID=45655 RepID=A0A975BX67_9BACT|nr:cache domain-containing protein [Desulfonema magnum]QTA92943.1 Double cache domain-containing protein [Desulfonema magnum]
MKKLMIVALAVLFGLCIVGNAFADEAASKAECIAKCEAVKAAILKDGLDGVVAKVNAKDAAYVSDVTYVFVQKMDGTMLGHPMNESLRGKNLITIKDKVGKEFCKEFASLAKEKGSGWVDYMWTKPGEEKPSQKISYVLKVNDDVFVGAGFYK